MVVNNNGAKGIDDAVSAGKQIVEVSGDDAERLIAEINDAAEAVNPSPGVKEARAARERLEPVFIESKDDPGVLLQKRVLLDLETIQRHDPAEWLRLKSGPLQGKVRDIERAIKDASPKQKAEKSETPSKPIAETVTDPPKEISPDAACPKGWVVDDGGVWENSFNPLDDGRRATSPILVRKIFRDFHTGEKKIELVWRDQGRWTAEVTPMKFIKSPYLIISRLGNRGFPIIQQNAIPIIKYLDQYIDSNYDVIPHETITAQMGWHENKKKRVFMYGAKPIGDIPLKFSGESSGQEQIAKGFISKGSYESWLKAVEPIKDFSYVQIMFYASLASVLLKFIDLPSFIVDISGATSRGKTISLRIAASIWGQPDEYKYNSVMRTWDTTKVGVERLATTFCHLPLIIDDSKKANPRDIDQSIYRFTSGQSRIRGSVDGMDHQRSWQNIMLSSGEQPLASYSPNGGARARVLPLWCENGPFEGQSRETALTVSKIDDGIASHYGFLGRKFIEWIMSDPDIIPDIKEKYLNLTRVFKEVSHGGITNRMAEMCGIISTAQGLIHQEEFGLPWQLDKTIWRRVWSLIVAESAGSDPVTEAYTSIYSWASSNVANFLNQYSKTSPFDIGDKNTKTYYGVWHDCDGEFWEELYIFPNILEDQMRKLGYKDVEGIIRQWLERGWLNSDREKSRKKRTQFFGKQHSFYCFRHETIKELEGRFDELSK